VGMNRAMKYAYTYVLNAPHMRGDEPVAALGSTASFSCSPHAWG
jgi:hypothetical protein